MPNSLEQWVEDLRAKDLPVLSRTAAALASLPPRANSLTAAEIAKVVYRDPLMTLKVLTVVNGMRRGRITSDITTVEHAVMMFGINPFFARFQRLATVEEGLGQDGATFVELIKVIARARHAAHLAWDWAVLRQDVRADEVYIAASLQHMGEMALWCFAPEQGLRARRLMRLNGTDMPTTFREVMGFDLGEFQMALGRAWNLPETYLDFMDPQNASRSRVLEATLAASIAGRAETGWYGEGLLKDMEAVATLLHMGEGETVARIHQQSVLAAREWEWNEVPPAAAWLPMLPGPWPAEPEEGEPPARSVCLAPHPEVERAMVKEIDAHMDGTLDLHELMTLVLKGMHEGLGLERVLFALLAADLAKVKAKYVLGAERDSPLRRFEFGMNPPSHLFARLMDKMQGVWFRAANREQLEPLLPPSIRGMIGEGEFYAMSVHVHDKPVGLFYGDRRHGACELDTHSYEEFKSLCLKAAQGLAHLAKPKPH